MLLCVVITCPSPILILLSLHYAPIDVCLIPIFDTICENDARCWIDPNVTSIHHLVTVSIFWNCISINEPECHRIVVAVWSSVLANSCVVQESIFVSYTVYWAESFSKEVVGFEYAIFWIDLELAVESSIATRWWVQETIVCKQNWEIFISSILDIHHLSV